MHAEMLPYECEKCKEQLETWQQLQDHLHFKICHANVDESIACERCGKKFTKHDSLRRHVSLCTQSTTTEENSLQCVHCERIFSRHCKLQAHLTKDVCRRGNICCVKCGAQFKSGTLLEAHCRETQCGDVTCTKCGRVFTTHLRHRYKEHIKVCSVGKREVDEVKTERKVSMRQRLLSRMHTSRDSNESVCCVDCRLQFDDFAALRQHVDDGTCRALYCHLCECSIRRRDSFVRHMRAHRMVSRTSSLCSHCHRSFADAISLRTHAARSWCPYQQRERMDTVPELLNEQKSHVCPFCTKIFQSQMCLNEHVYKIAHRGNACLKCMTLFDTHEELRWHYEAGGDCTFVCDGCKRVFANIVHVEQHRQQPCNTESDAERWQCSRCMHSFATQQLLLEHNQQTFKCERASCADEVSTGRVYGLKCLSPAHLRTCNASHSDQARATYAEELNNATVHPRERQT